MLYKSVSKMFQRCFKDVACLLMFQQCFNNVSTMFQPCFNDASPMFHRCFKYVAIMFQRCFNNVSTMFQGCAKDVPTMIDPTMEVSWVGVFQECFKNVSLVFHWFLMLFLDCFKGVMGVSLLSYGCFKCVLLVPKSSQLPEHKEGLFIINAVVL